MDLVYVDESGDPGVREGSSRYFILCGLSVHHADWHEPGGKALLRRYHRLWPSEKDKGR
jgi:hypothetical protein